MWTLLREVSLRHLRHGRFRTALVVFGIALGVCMLSAMLATNETLTLAFEDMIDRVAGKADLTVGAYQAGIPSSLTGEIADLEGVEHAAAMLEVVTRSGRPEGGTLLVLGVDLLGDTFFLPFAQEGDHKVIEDPLAFVNDPTAILLSKKLAETEGLKVGDALPLVTPSGTKSFRVRGLLEDEGPASSFGGQVAVMFIDAAQVTFERGFSVDRIDVVVARDANAADVQGRIEKLLGGRAKVEEPKGRARRLVASLEAFRNGLNTSGIIALGVGMFLIYNAVSVSVAQRRREVGILRALGVTRGKMVQLFCLEALVMASLGVVIGLLLARSLARIAIESVRETVSRVFMSIQPRPPEISLRIAIIGAVAGILATLVASYLPARATNRVDPAEALRATRSTSHGGIAAFRKLALIGGALALSAPLVALPGTEASGYLASLAIMVGFAMLVPVAVKVLRWALVGPVERLFGIPGRLALDNIESSLGRSATTVIALMLAISMSMTVGAYATSFERSITQWADDAFPSDAVVTAGAPSADRNHLPFSASVGEKLANVPGVAAVNPVRAIGTDVAGRLAALNALDTRIQLGQSALVGRGRKVLQGPERLDPNALYEAPRILISENLAHFAQLAPGDRAIINTASGPKPFTVYAVVVDYSSGSGWAMMDRRWYAEYWDDQLVDSLEVYFRPGVDRDATAEAVRRQLGASGSFFVALHDAMRDELRGLARSMFAYAKAPEMISLLVAIMGVIGTMLAAVLDRIREIGMLRAIGATRRQVTASMVAEAGFLGLSAVVCGVLTGVPQGYVFMDVIGMSANGWHLPYGFPGETALRVGGLVVIAAALAGFFPGRRAAGMDVKEALSYE